jgi:hypothetical protein
VIDRGQQPGEFPQRKGPPDCSRPQFDHQPSLSASHWKDQISFLEHLLRKAAGFEGLGINIAVSQ